MHFRLFLTTSDQVQAKENFGGNIANAVLRKEALMYVEEEVYICLKQASIEIYIPEGV